MQGEFAVRNTSKKFRQECYLEIEFFADENKENLLYKETTPKENLVENGLSRLEYDFDITVDPNKTKLTPKEIVKKIKSVQLTIHSEPYESGRRSRFSVKTKVGVTIIVCASILGLFFIYLGVRKKKRPQAVRETT